MDPKKLKNPVFLFNALTLTAFIIFYLIASGFSEGAKRFPKFVLGIGMAVIIFWMVIYFIFPRVLQFIEAQEDMEEGDQGDARRFYEACLCVILSVLAGYLLGFLFIVPAAFLSYGFMLGDRQKMATLIIVTVITTVLFYFGFDYLLNIPMLKGAILDLS